MNTTVIGNSILINEDCLKAMEFLIEKGIKVDAIITDSPYGTIACKWDSVIPLEPMWNCLNKLIKDNGAIVLFGSEPFSSALRMSNIKNYKYDWKWNKRIQGGFLNAKRQPLKIHEDIVVFNTKSYNPQMTEGKYRIKGKRSKQSECFGKTILDWTCNNKYYPKSILEDYPNTDRKTKLHPTQKPVALMEYLVKTYTNENDLVLDFTMGSGTTGVACQNLKRRFIGIEFNPEKDKTGNLIEPDKYFKVAVKRLQDNLERTENNDRKD